MVVKILNSLFIISNFLALTPSFLENWYATIRQKFYLLIQFLFYTAAALYCLYQQRILYSLLSATSLILRLLTDFTLYANPWFAHTDKLIQVDATYNDRYYYFVFILTHLVYATTLIVLTYTWIPVDVSCRILSNVLFIHLFGIGTNGPGGDREEVSSSEALNTTQQETNSQTNFVCERLQRHIWMANFSLT